MTNAIFIGLRPEENQVWVNAHRRQPQCHGDDTLYLIIHIREKVKGLLTQWGGR